MDHTGETLGFFVSTGVPFGFEMGLEAGLVVAACHQLERVRLGHLIFDVIDFFFDFSFSASTMDDPYEPAGYRI